MTSRCGSRSRSGPARCTPRPSTASPPTGPIRKARRRRRPSIPGSSDLIEILDHAASAEELLEHTRMAMYTGPDLRLHPEGRADPAAQGRDSGRLRLCRPYRSRRPDRRRQGQRPGDAASNPARKWRPGRDPRLQGPASAAGLAELRRHRQGARQDPPLRQVEGARGDGPLGRKIFDEIVQRLPAAARLGGDGRGAEAAAHSRRRLADGGDRAQARLRRRGDGGPDPRLDRQGGRQAAAAADRHLDQGPDPGRRLHSSPNAATRSPATGSSGCGARAPRSRSI